jgi:glycosyltransferase involved in cell wall biosynthesis
MANRPSTSTVMTKSKPNVIIVMPAYNAGQTLQKTVSDLPKGLASKIIVVDDGSKDDTVKVAKKLGLTVFSHPRNLGYGGNQKTCYWEALKDDPDVVVMLHPDYQYDATLTGEMVRPILEGRFDVMFGSRIRTRNEAIQGGMPLTKYILNRLFTPIENLILGVNFSEHMSGFRAYSKKVLQTVPFGRMSDDFVFDQQFMASAISFGFRVGEIPVPVRYYDDSSSIQFIKGSKFLLETLLVLSKFSFHQLGIYHSKLFK